VAAFRDSPQHGLNAVAGVCFFCRQADGTTVLLGYWGDDEPGPPEGVSASLRPCDDCAALMVEHVMFLTVDVSQDRAEAPVRVGPVPLLLPEALVRQTIRDPERRRQILQDRWAYLDAEAFAMLRDWLG
jgi:hypothetical protein